MNWIEYAENEGQVIYGKVSEDGKVRETAIKGHPELDAYLAWVEAGNNPEDFWTRDLDSPEGLEQPKEEETTEQPSSTDTKIETDLGE